MKISRDHLNSNVKKTFKFFYQMWCILVLVTVYTSPNTIFIILTVHKKPSETEDVLWSVTQHLNTLIIDWLLSMVNQKLISVFCCIYNCSQVSSPDSSCRSETLTTSWRWTTRRSRSTLTSASTTTTWPRCSHLKCTPTWGTRRRPADSPWTTSSRPASTTQVTPL